MEFLQSLLKRFTEMNEIDVDKASVKGLLEKLNEELTPIGGGWDPQLYSGALKNNDFMPVSNSTGKTMVEFFSMEIPFSVRRVRS